MVPPIVAIGASAGGVKALQVFFENVPPNTGAAFVVLVHLDPEHRSELSAILAARTSMQVQQVDETADLNPNSVYVIAPNRQLHLRVSGQTIAAVPFEEPRARRTPIDWFLRSLAQQHGNAFAVILTGAGADGSNGLKAVKEAGGIVLVQDPREAEYASMPRNAIATGMADFILPIRELAAQLADLLKEQRPVVADEDEAIVARILAFVNARTGHEFSRYKRPTVMRRIIRRAQICRAEGLEQYYGYMRNNVEEAQSLLSDLLISVTAFFRDPASFNVLAKSVIPKIFDSRGPNDIIRAWVPGCATGEEVYSLGMLLLDEANSRDSHPDIQIFGSDLNLDALASAREGRFPETIESDVPEDMLQRHFHKDGSHYRVRRELRDIALFAHHSLLRDPPFTKLDLVSCRNLLIYLDRELQQQVCSTLHYALLPDGYLFLGASESADDPNGLFRLLDRDARIYQVASRGSERRPLPVLLGSHGTSRYLAPIQVTRNVSNAGNEAATHRRLLELIAPPSMLVNESHRAVHLSDNAGRFLQASGGAPTTDATDMVRPELRFDMRAGLHRALERNEATLSPLLMVKMNGAQTRVYLQIKPVQETADSPRHALVLFIEGEFDGEDGEQASGRDPNSGEARSIRQLQEELQAAQVGLRSTREEYETAMEDLRAANEELQSINEEYRSTSEELETSKEELQSINEELQTVNSELKAKLVGLSRAHSDLQNLMAVTEIGTLFLDTSLRIKRFTPAVRGLFNVTEADEGRAITDFTHQLDYEQFPGDLRDVLADLAPKERTVRGLAGEWFLIRITPYRTIDDKIDGVVATFVDITRQRRAENARIKSDERLSQEIRLVELSRSPIFVWDFDAGLLQWNRGSEQLYGYSREEAVGKRKEALLQTSVPGSSFESLRATLLATGNWSGELHHTAKDGRTLTVESQLELIKQGDRRLVLESTRDVTDQRQWEKRRRLLVAELSHRVKNTLAVVQSMARQTMNDVESIDEFVNEFEGRLQSLSVAHRLLAEAQWEGADLQVLAREQLAAHFGGRREHLTFDGPSITLPAHLATPFGLVLHELATNSAKYGSLSTDVGNVALSWRVERRNTGVLLLLRWEERGGPPTASPVKQGFGGELIQQSIPGASVVRDFTPEGLVCTIELELPEETDDDGGIGSERRP